MSATLIVPREIAARLQAESCATCRFSFRDEQNDLNCRWKPPAVFTTVVPGGVQVNTLFPIVKAEQWCGEWQERATNAPTG